MNITISVQNNPPTKQKKIIIKPRLAVQPVSKKSIKEHEKNLAKRAQYKKKRLSLKNKHNEYTRQRCELFDYWTKTTCAICQDPMRELYQDGSPLENNEHYNMSIIELPCKHKFHHSCFAEWFKQSKMCPYCRAHSGINEYTDIKKIILPLRLPCRAIILDSKDKNRIGKQCECLESQGNFGFCKKHLVSLDEIFLTPEYEKATLINLVNRKLLTKLKLHTLRDYPPILRGEILVKAIKVLEKEPTLGELELLEKLETIPVVETAPIPAVIPISLASSIFDHYNYVHAPPPS